MKLLKKLSLPIFCIVSTSMRATESPDIQALLREKRVAAGLLQGRLHRIENELEELAKYDKPITNLKLSALTLMLSAVQRCMYPLLQKLWFRPVEFEENGAPTSLVLIAGAMPLCVSFYFLEKYLNAQFDLLGQHIVLSNTLQENFLEQKDLQERLLQQK